MRKREGSFVQTCFSRENSLAIEKGRTNRFSRILERSFEIERIYDSRLVSLSLSLSPLAPSTRCCEFRIDPTQNWEIVTFLGRRI